MSMHDQPKKCGFNQHFVKLSIDDSKVLQANIIAECKWSPQTFSHKKKGQRRLMFPRKHNKVTVNEVEIVLRNFANCGIVINPNNSQI